MSAPPPPTASAIARAARWCFTHRAATIAAWVVALVVAGVLGSHAGREDSADFRLPGTESQRAYDLLAERFPAANGDADQIVFRAREGTLRAPGVRRDAQNALERVARVPGVAAVASPFADGAGGGAVSGDGRIALATVQYASTTDDIETEDLQAVQRAAFSARSPALQVEHGGPGAYASAQEGGSGFLVGLLAAIVVLGVVFGSVVAAGVPLVAALFPLGSTLFAIGLLSHVVDTPDFATQLAELIGLGVGVDYALLVLTRYRSEVALGRTRPDAIAVALDTAGRTVVFAAATVVIALLGLLLLGLSFLHGVALGAGLAVLLTMLSTLTLLPALLGVAGDRIERLRFRRRAAGATAGASAGWARWAGLVQRRPWPAALAGLAILLALGAPALGLRLGSSDASTDPAGSTTRAAHELIAGGFGPGVNGTFLVVAEGPRGAAPSSAALARTRATLRATPGVADVSPARRSRDGSVATFALTPATGPQDAATDALLDRLREDVVPRVERATQTTVLVGGLTATIADFSDVIAGKLPVFVGVVVLLSALLLLVAFRSVLVPRKAAAMHLLSIGAALGVVTLVFQDGVLAETLGVGTGPIEPFVPVLTFAIVFGLSMDYEVFLVSRMHEEFSRDRDASRAVRAGLAATGRTITAAAAIMVVVFAAFVLGDGRVIKMFGVGLAVAVLLDAVVIRCLLVPALMELMGRRAWWVPRRLERALPRVAIEPPRDPAAAPA